MTTNNTIFIGDVDEYYCDSRDDYNRWAVWVSYGENGRIKEKLLGKFATYEEAEKTRDAYLQKNPLTSTG